MQDVVGSNPARGSSFFLLRKKELSSGVVVYFALSLRMSLHVRVHGVAHHPQYSATSDSPDVPDSL